MREVIRRREMLTASLDFGGTTINLADYATTGLVAVAVGPRGNGKTNAGLLVSEQLAQQGWVSVLIDPEQELQALYGKPVRDADELLRRLVERTHPIVVVEARDASEFVPYGEAILKAADDERKPMFVMLDEGQLWSATRKRSSDIGRASDIVNDMVGRGRKRALDLFVTALRYSGTLHRSIFSNKNLTLIGCQEDPSAWAAMAPQFRSTKLDFADLNALAPGEFFCLHRRGIEKVRMPMAGRLQEAGAPKAKRINRALPANYTQWDRALRAIPTERLRRLNPEVTELLGSVAGLSAQQMATGHSALADELAVRS